MQGKRLESHTSPTKPIARRLRNIAQSLLELFRPISPQHWPVQARRLASHPNGWMPPMMMIAALGVIVPLNVCIGWLGNVPLMKTFNLLTWIAWFIVGGAATLVVALQSIRNLFRLGLQAMIRHRWWFELARLLWIACLFSTISMAVSLFAIVGDFGFLLLEVMAISFVGFMIAASMGYALSFASGKPRHGRAFECVHYFYCILGSIGLLVTAIVTWPEGQFDWSTAIASVVLAVAGIVLMTYSFISTIIRGEKTEAI